MADKITKWTDDELIALVTSDMEKAKMLQDELSKQRDDYYKWYRMEKYGNEREGFAKSVAPVIHNNHRWSMANLMDIFTDDFFILKGENEERTAKLQKLIFYQMFRKQDGYRKFYDFIWSADLYHYAVFKCYYKEDFELITDTHDALAPEEMMQLAQTPEVSVSKFDEEEDDLGGLTYKNVKTVTKKMNYAGPWFTCLPLWEFSFSPDCKITDWGAIEGRLVTHKVQITLNDVRKKEKAKIYRKGTFEKVKEKYMDVYSDPQDKTDILFNVDAIPQIDLQDSNDKKDMLLNRLVEVNECYFRLDIDSDGLLEHVVMDYIDDVVCRIEENPYNRPPFRIGHISPEPHKVVGHAMPNLLENEQKIQTNLLRLIQDSAALDCYKNPVTNDHHMFMMLQDRKPFAVIKGDPARLGEVKTSPPSEFILKAYEMQQGQVEQMTGMTRYNQGMDASSLNKTATGIDAIMAASSKPLRLIARILGNGAIMGLIRDFIFINQTYPPQTDIKILGTDITVNPDDMTGEHDVEIDIGVSPAEKQSMANQIDLLIQFATQAGIPMGIQTPGHVIKAQQKKYKYLGIKVDDLMLSEQQFIENQKQKEGQPQKPDIKEYVQLDKLYPLLTPMEQAQILQNFGIQPDPSRQNMPPEALSGMDGPMGGPQPGTTPQQQQMEHMQGLKQSHDVHKQKLAQSQQQHQLRLLQTAMDIEQKAKQPYPKGTEKK